MDEQATRFAVLLEDMNRNLGVLAEAVAVLDADSKALKTNFEGFASSFGEMTFEMRELKQTVSQVSTKVDKLEGKVDKLEGKVDKLEAFATEAGPRLVRIEAHLALPAPSSRRETTSPLPSKHHRRKPAKRT